MGKAYTHLSLEERAVIQTRLEQGNNPSQIAVSLRRSVSTITRELKRNGWIRPQGPSGRGRPPVAGGYRGVLAQHRAHANQCTPRVARRLQTGTALWARVKDFLKNDHSPEQIAGVLAHVHSDTPSLRVSHETIYTAIYALPRGALRTQVIGWLRHGTGRNRCDKLRHSPQPHRGAEAAVDD